MRLYAKVVFVWMVSINSLQCVILDRYLTQEDMTLYINSTACYLNHLVQHYKQIHYTELHRQCRLVVDFETQNYSDNYHSWGMVFHLPDEEIISSISRKLQKCKSKDREKVFTMSCEIFNNSSLGDICLSNKNCVNNTVCSLDKFNGRCTCQKGYREENGQCIKENVTLGKTCSDIRQCRQSNTECRKSLSFCKRQYLQIENNCGEKNKSLGSQCQYHEQCTGTVNAGLCLGNSSYLQCTCNRGFVDRNRSCIELPEQVNQNMGQTFFDTKASAAICSGIISFIFGASITTLIFAVYSSKSRSLENHQNLSYKQRFPKSGGVTLYRKTDDGSETGRKTKCHKKSAASIEVVHEVNDRNHENAQDPCLYNHLNEKEIESVSENKYGTAERETHNDAENTYAQVQPRKGSSKQLIIDDIYMPVTLENDL